MKKLKKKKLGKAVTVFVHLGVAASRKLITYTVESAAYNNSTFRCPDELGWGPIEQPIVIK